METFWTIAVCFGGGLFSLLTCVFNWQWALQMNWKARAMGWSDKKWYRIMHGIVGILLIIGGIFLLTHK